MKERPSVEVGQVYEEKDKRMFKRRVKVMEIEGAKAKCQRCSDDGSEICAGFPATRIALKNLQTRFILITEDKQ